MNVQNRPEYAVLLSTLSPSAQLRYFKEHGQPFPLVSEKPASAKAYKPLDHFSAAEREEIRQEMETLARWQEYRRQPGRTAELDAEFVELLRQEDPGRAVSVKTLYRKKKALEENDLAGLVDGRGKARKGRSSIDETVWQAFLSFYLDLREPKAKECYEATIQYVRRHYPALVDGIPTYSTFVRHIEKDVPYAVQQLGREGKKALRDRCAPYVRRIYDNMENVFVRDLLPVDERFDMNMHILSFAPGGCHPFVETHVQEHGAYLYEGEGLYLLNDDWVPVKAEDFIWMGAYCKQCCYGVGLTRLSYIYSKDCHRDAEI